MLFSSEFMKTRHESRGPRKRGRFCEIFKSDRAKESLVYKCCSLFYWNALRINIGSLVGQQFEAVYEFDKTSRNLTPVKMSDTELFELIGTSSDITSLEEVDDTKDNRFLNDDGKSQKLSRDDIEVLKSEGMAGQQIIETLVENSSTFKAKSAFAQEKYLKKKKEKYSNYFRVMNPTSRLLTEMYHSQSPYKL